MNFYNYYISRSGVLSEALTQFYKDCYKFAQPKIDWDDFIQQNKEFMENGEQGPKPYEFYYLPEHIFKELQEMYIDAYSIKSQFSNHIDLLISYFNDPIRDKWIEKGSDLLSRESGYRGYEHFSSLKEEIGEEAFNKVLDYFKEANEFYSRDPYYNAFLMESALGPTPSSNKDRVIENWKKYRNEDITIDESMYKLEEEDEDWEGTIE